MQETDSSSVSLPAPNLILFNNDLIDSDNWAAAWAIAVAARDDPSTEVAWIVESRKVALGLSMTGGQVGKCLQLIKKYFPARGKELKILVGALLSDADVDGLDGIGDEDRSLVCIFFFPGYTHTRHLCCGSWRKATY